jgi:hypothetical protein
MEILTKKEGIIALPSEVYTVKTDMTIGDPSKMAILSAHPSKEQELVLTNFIRENKNIFAWKMTDMPGILRQLVEHRSDVNPGSKSVKQRIRRFLPDKKAIIKKEITKLLSVSFIRKILHSDWMANPVHV